MRIVFIISIVILLVSGCTERGENKIFLLPKDFAGYAIIFYDQKNGSERKYIMEKQLFEIPLSGTLKTQFKADYKRTDFPEFYFSEIKDNNKIPLSIDSNKDKESSEKIIATMPNIGKIYKNNKDATPIEYSIFYIGTKYEIEIASKEVANLNLHDLVMN